MSARSFYNSSKHNSFIGSSVNKAQDLVSKLDEQKIESFAIGIKKMFGNGISSRLAHIALFLTNEKVINLEKGEGEGIIIEYGYYSPNENDKEKDYVRNGQGVYKYGNKGGLIYYIQNISEFIDNFGCYCYIFLDTEKENQMTFSYFVEKIAPIQEEKWIKERYYATDLKERNNNCQSFGANAYVYWSQKKYDKKMFKNGKDISNDDFNKNIESKIPPEILLTLNRFKKGKI